VIARRDGAERGRGETALLQNGNPLDLRRENLLRLTRAQTNHRVQSRLTPEQQERYAARHRDWCRRNREELNRKARERYRRARDAAGEA
jgi:hypothetical protein